MTARAGRGSLLVAIAVIAVAAAVVAAPGRERATPATAETALAGDMAEAARRFLSTLSAEQRRRANLPFDAAARTAWRYTPGARAGITLDDLDAAQRHLAYGFLATALSRKGLLKASGIMALEEVLRRRGGSGFVRDPGAYSFAIYGEPAPARSWGWRLEGHHLSIHATVVDGVRVVVAPTFLGANPARVAGDYLGHAQVLGREEELGFRLLASLDDAQRRQATYAATAPADILTGPGAALRELPGLPASRLGASQRQLLDALVDEALGHLAPELAARERARLAAQPGDRLLFTWAGGHTPGRPHYFRVSGPTFLYELDNTQEDANHVHTVWHARAEAGGDFGADLLRQHLRTQPHRAPSAAEREIVAEIRGAWSRPVEPFRVVGNIYYVGAANIAAYLIVTSQGLILLDTGTREMAAQVRRNIVALGFALEDVALILTSHAHFDHVEGHAEMQRLTGARVAAMAAEVPALSSGEDRSAIASLGWEPVAVDRVLRDGEEVTLGDVTLRALWTPGHTPGNTTWVTTAREHGRSYQVVFVGVPLANAGVRLTGNERHPSIVEDLARTHRVLKELRPDIWLIGHPAELFEGKLARLRAGATPHPLVDPGGYARMVAEAEAHTQRVLAEERAGK